MMPLPHVYEVRLRRGEGPRGTLSSGDRPPLEGAAPPEFDGPPGLWSPEHLLLASASLCLMSTFLIVAARSQLEVGGYESRAEGTLDKTAEGFVFTRILLRVTVTAAAAQGEKALRLLGTAHRHCIVSNSLKKPIEVEAELRAV